MAVPSRPTKARVFENQRAGDLPTLLTLSQRRILRLLQHGDLIWEIADNPHYCTLYNEKRGHNQRIRTATVVGLEQHGRSFSAIFAPTVGGIESISSRDRFVSMVYQIFTSNSR